MSRQLSITAEIIAAVANDLARPIPFKYACERNGISEGTGYNWLKRGESGEEPFDAFLEAVTRARANGVANLVDHSLAGGRGSQSATWHLERQYREHFGDIKRVEHAGHDGGAVQISAKPIDEMTDEELERAYLRLTSGAGGALPPAITEAPSADEPAELLREDGPGVRPEPSTCEDHL